MVLVNKWIWAEWIISWASNDAYQYTYQFWSNLRDINNTYIVCKYLVRNSINIIENIKFHSNINIKAVVNIMNLYYFCLLYM